MSVRDTRQIAIYLDAEGRVVDKQTLSADRREVTYLPQDATRVVTTPQGFKSGKTNINPPAEAGDDFDIRKRKSQNVRQRSFGARSVGRQTKYRRVAEADYNYFGAFYKLRMYSDGCGDFRVGEDVEQSYFKPISSLPFGRGDFSLDEFGDLDFKNAGPRHTVTDAAVSPHISSLYFGGTGDNITGNTGGILYIDTHPSIGFTTGFTANSDISANNTYMHADFFIKPLSKFSHNTPIFGKSRGATIGGGAEFALVARNNGLAWTFTKTNAGSTATTSEQFEITTDKAKEVVGVTGALSLGGTAPWFHIQVERALSQFRFYIDGTLTAVHGISSGDGIIGADGDFIIGGHRDGTSSLNMLMDQFHYRLGSPGATNDDAGVLGRGFLGGGFTGNLTYAKTDLTVGATVSVPTTGVEEFKDRHTKLLMPFDGIHLCPRVVERGNNLVTGRIVGWDSTLHHLFIDNVGFTGDLVSGTGDQGSEYFSRDYGWVFGERGDAINVGGLRNLQPSTSQIEPTFSATSSAAPSPHATIHPTSFSPSISPTPTTTIGFTGGHPGATGFSPTPSPVGHFGGFHPTPQITDIADNSGIHKTPGTSPAPSFTPQPSSSASPSVSPTVSVSPTTTLSSHELLHPTTSINPHPTEPVFSPTPSINTSVSGPETSPSVCPTPTTSFLFSPHLSPHFALSPTPSPTGTTGPFGSPHLVFHSHAHPQVTPHGKGTISPTIHGVSGSSPSPTIETSATGGVASPTPTIHFPNPHTTATRPPTTISPSPHEPVPSPTPHWFSPLLSPHQTARASDEPEVTIHGGISNTPRPTGPFESPIFHVIDPSPSIIPSNSPPPIDETGSLATWEMEDYDLLLTLREAQDLAVEEAINEATRNLDQVISGTQGHAGDLKYLFEDSTGSSGSAALTGVASVSEPDGSGTRTFGGITNPETGIVETYHFFAVKPTNDLINRLNAIVTAGAYGKQDSFYIIPNAFGVEHYLTYHDCRLLFLDLVNYRYKVQNAFTSTVSAIERVTEIAEVRTAKTRVIPADKSGAFKGNRITSYSEMVTTSASALKKTGVSSAQLSTGAKLSSLSGGASSVALNFLP